MLLDLNTILSMSCTRHDTLCMRHIVHACDTLDPRSASTRSSSCPILHAAWWSTTWNSTSAQLVKSGSSVASCSA